MKTTFNKLMLLATCMLLSLKTLAYDFEVDGIYYNILSEKDKTVEVTKNENEYADSCYSGNVIIPENVKYNNESYGIIRIGFEAFSNCSSLTSVTIPNSVTTIESLAFSNCSSLTFINIPNNVKAIESCTFYMCQSLGSVTIGNNVKTIGESAFYKCSSLTSITIPKCVTSIGIEAFY